MSAFMDKPPEGDKNRVVRVAILGQEYPVRSEADEEYVREIAAYVDARMSAIRRAHPSWAVLRTSVLAALNLADEVFTLKHEKEELMRRYETKLRELAEHLDRSLFEQRI